MKLPARLPGRSEAQPAWDFFKGGDHQNGAVLEAEGVLILELWTVPPKTRPACYQSVAPHTVRVVGPPESQEAQIWMQHSPN